MKVPLQLNLAGKTAFVSGASKGIGFAVAERLVQEGCRVAINGRDGNALSAAAERLGHTVVQTVGDVTKPGEASRVMAHALDELGSLDVLVCNVGSGASVPPGQETFDEWQRVFALNLWSTTNLVEVAQTALAKAKGSIVCVSSICGGEVVPGAPVTYSAAKAALDAYVRGVARPLGQLGVRINAVAPGNILFDGSVWERKLRDDPDAVAAMLKKEVALGALGRPQQVADWVAWLASEKSTFATGGIYRLDGGQMRS